MSKDIQGNDVQAVRLPVTGGIAWAPVDAANVITPAEGGDAALKLLEDHPAYKPLGLLKTDGGYEQTVNSTDATQFFQQGYKLAGDDTIGFKVALAQSDLDTLQWMMGVTFDKDHHAYRENAFNTGPFLVFHEVEYKNRDITRRNGVAMIVNLDEDKDQRGSIKGYQATCEWIKSPLFNGSSFSQWEIPAPKEA